MTYDNLIVERRPDHIAIVTFNRPEKANALNPDLLQEIEAVAHSFRDDGDTRVVVFAGAGKHFTSGADLSDQRSTALAGEPMVLRRRYHRFGQRAIRALYDMDQITVAAMQGAAMGGGACVATALDFRIGADDCFVAYPEVDIGVNLNWTALPLIVHIVGPSRAKRLVAGNERTYAPTLLDWGFLEEVVERDQLMDKALEWAAFYAAKAPVPAQMIKRSVNHIVSALDLPIMHMDFDQNLFGGGLEDAKEARDSYLAQRKPAFEGN